MKETWELRMKTPLEWEAILTPPGQPFKVPENPVYLVVYREPDDIDGPYLLAARDEDPVVLETEAPARALAEAFRERGMEADVAEIESENVAEFLLAVRRPPEGRP